MHSYPKIYNIGHAAVSDLFLDPVLVEEKIDGSQFSFMREGNEIKMRSRNSEVFMEYPGMFNNAALTVAELAPSLTDGWVYRGEYLAKPKHNVLPYTRIPKGNIILFDINTGDEKYLPREHKEAEAARLGLEIVPLLQYGVISSPEEIKFLLQSTSILGGPIEGIVIKNYQRFGIDGKVLMGKFVTETFKETHSKAWKADNPQLGDVVERIIATVRNPVRWQKAVFRLRDSGDLENSPRDIGKLIKEIQSDIKAEESDYIAQKLVEYALPRVLRASTGGFAEWYKEELMKSAFPAVESNHASENGTRTEEGSSE